MIYDCLKEFGRDHHQDVTFCVVGANNGMTNDHLFFCQATPMKRGSC